jgi:hypothetical protein
MFLSDWSMKIDSHPKRSATNMYKAGCKMLKEYSLHYIYSLPEVQVFLTVNVVFLNSLIKSRKRLIKIFRIIFNF